MVELFGLSLITEFLLLVSGSGAMKMLVYSKPFPRYCYLGVHCKCAIPEGKFSCKTSKNISLLKSVPRPSYFFLCISGFRLMLKIRNTWEDSFKALNGGLEPQTQNGTNLWHSVN